MLDLLGKDRLKVMPVVQASQFIPDGGLPQLFLVQALLGNVAGRAVNIFAYARDAVPLDIFIAAVPAAVPVDKTAQAFPPVQVSVKALCVNPISSGCT